MGMYIYAETGKTLTVSLPTGGSLEAGVVAYVTKPDWDLWDFRVARSFHSKQDRQIIASYNRLRRKWDRMSAHPFVVQEFDDGTRYLYKWVNAEPQAYFFDDETFGITLVRIGMIDSKGCLQPYVMGMKKGCELFVFWDRYVMNSPATGRHSLAVDCTPPERLAAHWKGFLECQPLEVLSL